MIDRKDLLLESDKPKQPVNESRVKDAVTKGGALLAMTQTYGWQILREEFIDKRININRLLIADVDKLADERSAMRELLNLVAFVDNSIKAGIHGNEVLKEQED